MTIIKTPRRLAGYKSQSEKMHKLWQDPEFRKKHIERQKKAGLRGWTDLYYSRRKV